jgi:hypothetical protein
MKENCDYYNFNGEIIDTNDLANNFFAKKISFESGNQRFLIRVCMGIFPTTDKVPLNSRMQSVSERCFNAYISFLKTKQESYFNLSRNLMT